MIPLRSAFPKDFLIGSATSSYQIEGHAAGGAGRTIWDDFAATEGNVRGGDDGRIACDHYNRYEEDLNLLQAGGFETYRFSTSWARILPEGRGQINEAGLDFYERLVDGLLARGIKPAMTLYHWELPSALQDKGGWANREIADWFADYTEIVMKRLGDRIWSTAPINEPWCVSFLSHFHGAHAPGIRNIRLAARAMHHVCYTHGRSVEVMRGLGIKNIGAVCNMEYANPADSSPEAQAAVERYDGYYNLWFLEGMINGRYPKAALEGLEPYLPRGWQDDMKAASPEIDWVGINYYTRKNITHAPGQWPNIAELPGPLPKTSMDWEIYPEGLQFFIERTHRDFAKGKPIYITENGMAAHDRTQKDGIIQDEDRIAYYASHLEAVARAARNGANVGGYYAWSLLDNYEWAWGYDTTFGLIHVDFETQKRTPKASFYALKEAFKR